MYPSRYEGFGLPLIEAMPCGAPVIAARAGSIPEVVGDAGLLLDPDDVRGFADALEQALTDRELAGRMREASIARAQPFSWRDVAARTAEVYRRCARARHPCIAEAPAR